jgi:hypothetical protein
LFLKQRIPTKHGVVSTASMQRGILDSVLELVQIMTHTHTHMGRFYLAIVQAQLLYGSETWVISKRAVKRLESFHNRCARTIAHRPIRRLPDGTWEYPPTEEVLNMCGLSNISTYIAQRKTRLLNRYAKPESQIYNLCKRSTPVGSSAHRQMWWT